ncbi:hypothetical protein JXJ21_03140 [candidate division KSB1 bacterium]|nr:hypothetical protein [candidate division KSB1 bacterium]
MTSKERVIATLEGRIPDRVPLGEFAVDFDTVEKIIGHETYLRAKAKSQIAFWENRHDEVAQSWLEDHIELHRKLGVLDIVTFPAATWALPPETDSPPRKIDDNTWEDASGKIYKLSEITADITCVHDPEMWTRQFNIEDYSTPPEIQPPDPRSQKIIETVIQKFKNDKFICTPCGGEIGIVFLGGMQRGSMEMLDHPDIVHAAAKYALASQNQADEIMIHPDGDGVLWGDDFASTSGPFISPDMFRKFFLEPNRTRVNRLKNDFGLKVLKHACGNNWKLLDVFVEIGYDCYQSIQHTAGMDIRKVKAAYGEKLTLWGGVPVEYLMSGTADEVRQSVRYAMKYARQGGRFILGTSHSIAVGSNYENYMAMLDEYDKLADYQ